jgi:6-phosphogluconolactonase
VSQNRAADVLLFVGSYSEPVPHALDAHGAGLSIFEVELATGRVRTRFEDDSIRNPHYLCVDARRRMVYAVSEMWDGNDGTVTALHFDPGFESVLSRSDLSTGGGIPSYVSVVGDSVALVSNYGDGTLASFLLSSDGHLVAPVSLVPVHGSGPDVDRQRGAHGHCVLPNPRNGQIYAADLGADKLMRLSLDLSNGTLTRERELHVRPGSGPRHVAFDPSSDLALVVNELSSRLGVWRIGADGDLIESDDLPMLPDNVATRNLAADIAVASDGSRAFASNRGHDSVVMYEKSESGGFRVAGWRPTGRTPRSLALTPGDGYLFVANQDSDTVQAYQVAAGGGLAEDFAISTGTPSCVKCIAVPPPA